MIVVVEYGAGNTASVANALSQLGVEYKISDNEMLVGKAEKIIFPGVGEASSAVKQLHLNNLFTMLRVVKKPLLGICLGMQLLAEHSDEGDVACLGVVPTTINKFLEAKGFPVPHMGWNSVKVNSNSPLFEGIKQDEFFYFAHSYYMPINEFTTATADYGIPVTAAIRHGYHYGVQFHPEKSGEAGLKILKNFVDLCS